jgi:uncharacterized membrane protein
MNKKILLVLVLISCIGLFLRFYKVESIPNGLTWDEAALGYNAFSISKTLRDEHGKFLPLAFTSFGDFKPPIYIYLTAPIVSLLGLSEVSTRLLSVLSGTLAIFLLYLLVKEATNNTKWALLCSLLLAVSPWHIFYSRGAWETNLMTTFLILGLFGIIRSTKNKSGLLWGLAALFLSMMTYQAGKLYVPLILIVLFWTGYLPFNTLILKNRSKALIWLVFGMACAGLLSLNLFTSDGNRLNRLSILNYKPDLNQENKKYGDENSIFHSLFDLRVRLIASRYLTHYSTDFLFVDNKPTDRGHLPKIGMMYWVDALFVVIGLFALVGLKDKKFRNLVLGLVIIGAIPGALTLADYSSTRNLFLVIPLTVVSGLGVLRIIEKNKIWPILIAPFWLFGIVYFWDIFMVHSNIVLGKEYNIGYKKVYQALSETKPSRAVITDVYGQPYIYYLFYGKIDPAWYQKQNEYRENGIDVGYVGRVGDIEFRQFDVDEIKRSPNAFFAGAIGNYSGGNVNDLDNIIYSDEVKVDGQEIMFKIVKTK